MLARGAQLLQSRMQKHAGLPVTYGRPGKFTINSLIAVPGRNPVDIVDRNGVVLRGMVQDWIFTIDELVSQMTADPRRPVKADEITAIVGSFRIVFIVTAEDFSSSHYEPADSYGVAWRVHTRSDRLVSN